MSIMAEAICYREMYINKEDKSSPRHRGSDFPSENKED